MTAPQYILSPLAVKLLNYLRDKGAKTESECVEFLFPKPIFLAGDAESQRAFWRWEVASCGGQKTLPVCGGDCETFGPVAFEQSYSAQTCAAYQELARAGLAGERNNGCNSYAFYARPRDKPMGALDPAREVLGSNYAPDIFNEDY